MPSNRLAPRFALTATALGLGSVLLVGCAAAEPETAGSAKDAKASHVTVTATSDGGKDTCTLNHDSVPAGAITFTVVNKSSSAITEVELLSKQRIIGEKENLAPGLKPVSFTVTLTGGTYQIYCPGAATETRKFTVTGKAAPQPTGSVSTVLNQATEGYAKYVDETVSGLVTAVGNLKSAIDAGDLEKAKTDYALARPFYERIESDVDGFVLPGHSATDNSGNLDYLIDMRESNLDAAVGWHGFHAIERDLFQGGAITQNTRDLAAELSDNVAKLQKLVGDLRYKPEDLANGAAGLMEEVQSGKIRGEEESFSHLDLVDFAGNVEGAQQAFAFLRPGLKKIDADLTARVSTQFGKVTALLDRYKDPSALGGYKTYTAALRASDAATLSRGVQALQEPLSKIAEKVATAR